MAKISSEKERQKRIKSEIKDSVEQRSNTFQKLKKLTDRHLNLEKKIESCKMSQRNYIERINKAKLVAKN